MDTRLILNPVRRIVINGQNATRIHSVKNGRSVNYKNNIFQLVKLRLKIIHGALKTFA